MTQGMSEDDTEDDTEDVRSVTVIILTDSTIYQKQFIAPILELHISIHTECWSGAV